LEVQLLAGCHRPSATQFECNTGCEWVQRLPNGFTLIQVETILLDIDPTNGWFGSSKARRKKGELNMVSLSKSTSCHIDNTFGCPCLKEVELGVEFANYRRGLINRSGFCTCPLGGSEMDG